MNRCRVILTFRCFGRHFPRANSSISIGGGSIKRRFHPNVVALIERLNSGEPGVVRTLIDEYQATADASLPLHAVHKLIETFVALGGLAIMPRD